jgi:hypothetical protein
MSTSHPNEIKTTDNLLFEWKEYSDVNSEMHEQSIGYFKFWNHGLMIPSMILGSVTGIGTIFIANNGEKKQGQIDWVLVGFGVIGIVSTLLVSIHRFMNVERLQSEHDFYSDMFGNVSNEIEMHLTLDQKDETKMFKNKEEFVKYCKYRMDVLIDKAPPIPEFIKSKSNPVVRIVVG